MLEQTANIDFWQDMVKGLIVSRGTIKGVITGMGQEIRSKCVVLTNGTFLNGVIHIGEKQFGGGRIGEKGATGITEQLVELGFDSARLKTGTPPRVDGRSLDYTKMEIQDGDTEVVGFSYLPIKRIKPHEQRCCWITYTSPQVHNILKTGFEQSPMYQGRIKGSGPRYCPSIEDKISRFAERDRHQLFVEPEGWNTIEIYVNGFSTSLPEDVQFKALKMVPGFEHCKFFRPGYAIEYDYFPPTQLNFTLETKLIHNLFFAGQINGTTGYEEAACQGLMAGINASRLAQEEDAVVLKRSDAYIGVLIDDLINKGTDEPYRMFTSRAEYRTLLRQDNADLRLTELGHKIGLASDERLHLVGDKKQKVGKIKNVLAEFSLDKDMVKSLLENNNSPELSEKVRANKFLLRPGIGLKEMMAAIPALSEAIGETDALILEQAEIQVKYKRCAHRRARLHSRDAHTDVPCACTSPCKRCAHRCALCMHASPTQEMCTQIYTPPRKRGANRCALCMHKRCAHRCAWYKLKYSIQEMCTQMCLVHARLHARDVHTDVDASMQEICTQVPCACTPPCKRCAHR